MTDMTLQTLMEAGVHFGHQTKRWNPKMKKYIFGARNGIYIIDLQKSLERFNKAMAFARKIGAAGGVTLFIATKPQAQPIIVEEAKRCGMPYVTERWLGGTLTNFETIRKSVGRLKEVDAMSHDGTFDALSKKEVIKLQKELDKLMKNLGGLRDMEKLPDAVFVIDTKKERIALSEARKLGIPIIAVVDTNCDPDGIEHVIPANDDALKSIRLMAASIADAILAGKTEYEMKQKAFVEEREKNAAVKRAESAAVKKAVAEADAGAAAGAANGAAQ
jgi:small subunit ribosomal protein S2